MKRVQGVIISSVLVFGLFLALAWTPPPVSSNQAFTLRTRDGLSLTLDSSGAVSSARLATNEILTNAGGIRLREISPTIVNRAPNPGFELGTNTPVNWTLSGLDWSWDRGVTRSGARSAKIAVPPPTDQVSSNLRSTNFSLLPDTSYDFSAWFRTQGVGGTYQPAIRVVEMDAAGNVLHDENGRWLQHAIDIPHGTADWQSMRIVFRTRGDCRQGYIYANIWNAYGTIWFDDVSLAASLGENPEITVGGSVTQVSPNVLVQRARLDTGLTLTATYTAHENHIRIDGELLDHEGKERGLQVTFSLPMDANGWHWGDDIRNHRVVDGANRYENTVRLPYGGTFSQYPFSSLSGPSDGLSLAVPMDVPRIQRTSYARGLGYQTTFDLGLSPATTKLGPGRAMFSLVLYRYDTSWGFRSAAAKYYTIFPQFFTKRVKSEGLWIGGFDPGRVPNPSDFGFAFDQDGDRQLISDARQEMASFRYLEPWGWWRKFGSDPEKPPYPERVAALLSDATSGAGTWEGAPLVEVAQGVINTSLINMAGRYYLDASDHFWHYWGAAGNPGYYQNYPTNPDPDIPLPNRSQVAWQYELGRAMERAAQTSFIDDWTFSSNGYWDTTAHTGAHAALVSVPVPSNRPAGRWRSELIPVTPGGSYTFSAWIRGEGLAENSMADLFVVEHDAQGEPILPWTQHSLAVPWGTYDWTPRSVTFTAGAKTRAAYIYGVIWEGGSGKVWFDDVALRATNASMNLVANPGFERNQRGQQTGTRLDGAYLDSLHVHWAWSTLENYRQDHWAVVDQPLVFSYETKRPTLLGFLSHYEFVDWIARRMHDDARLLMGNVFYDAYPYFAHRLDVLGSEIATIDSDARANIRRTLSYQKPNSNLMQWHLWEGGSRQLMTREDVEAYIKSSLFYGFFPSIFDAGEDPVGVPHQYWNTPALYERDRDLFRHYVPIIQTITGAGWEPVTQAWMNNKNVWVERFGPEMAGSSQLVYFTVHNPTATHQTYTLTMDVGQLGFDMSRSFTITELTSNTNVPVTIAGGLTQMNQTIASGDTKVFRLTGVLR